MRKSWHRRAIGLTAVEQRLQLAVGLDAAVLADAQEDDAVDGHLDGVVQVALAESGVAQGDVVRQQVAPALDLGQEGVVHLGGAALACGGFGVLVEGAFEDGLVGEDGGNLVPLGGILAVGEQHDAPGGGFVGLVGLDAAVVDGELLEIGQDGEGQLGGPGVAAELVGGGDLVLEVDGGLLGFDEELARAADAEGVIGGLGGAADLDGSPRGSRPCRLRRSPACCTCPSRGLRRRGR